MAMIWLALVLQITLLGLTRTAWTDPHLSGIIVILGTSIIVFAYLFRYSSSIRAILCTGYVLRVCALLLDVYGKSILHLPHSGSDTEGFYLAGRLVSNNLGLLREHVYGGVYSKLLGILFHMVGPNRLIAQYINVLLGLGILIAVHKTLSLLGISHKRVVLSLATLALFPHAIIFSSILLREAIVSWLVAWSLYYFVKWYIKGSVRHAVLPVALLVCGSMFHSGVIALAAGYLFMYIFFCRSTNKLRFSLRSIIILVLVVVTALAANAWVGDTALYKFQRIDELSDLISAANVRAGGSAYLSSMNVNSPLLLLSQIPLRILYFISSPLPTDWRGINDIMSFALDGIIYLAFMLAIVGRVRKLGFKDPLLLAMLLGLLAVLIVFSVGVANSGTAMRHRHKILPFIVVVYNVLTLPKNKHLRVK